MNARDYIKVDKAAFLRFVERQAEGRFEYEEGHIVQQMSGGTFAHMRIVQRFVSAFERRLDAKVWVTTSQGRGVETPKTIRYPDVVVEAMGGDAKALSTDKPVALVEVLSPTTQELDINTKPAEYMSLASLEAYIVASQDAAQCWIWVRNAERHFAELPEERSGSQAALGIDALGISIPLAEIYRGIAGEP
jgi:Uma2 family endonuclease